MNDSSKSAQITRREAIFRVSAMFGGIAIVGQTAMLGLPEASQAQTRDALFDDEDIALLDEVAETILPETDTPGAKAAGVGAFMALMVTDAYYPQDQTIFKDGIATLNARARESYGREFDSATADQRLALLQALDAEQFEHMQNKDGNEPTHFFRMMKELALLGYFTSEIGYTKAMRYIETPGRYDPCVPYEDGEKTWARHA
ncbi:MAG: gluconate 2-dehydrogenase subunit 3 family protein [Pseudomonadota bacterium]